MTQAELEALLAQIAPNGQTVRLEHTEEMVERKSRRLKPKAHPSLPDEYEEVTERVPVQTWIDRGTGMTLRVQTNPDGTYTKLSQGPDPKAQGDPATKPSADVEPKSQVVQGGDGAYYTVTQTPGASGGPPTVTVTNAQGQPVPGNVVPGKPAAADNVGTPTGNVRQSTDGGTTTKEVEYVLPDGRKEWRTQTASDPQSQQPTRTSKPVQGKDGQPYTEVTEKNPQTGQTRTYYTDASGKEVPLPGDSKMPANAPTFTPDWNKPALGVIEYASAIRARPDLTDAQKAELITVALQQSNATANHAQTILNSQQTEAGRATTERGQDTAQANTRLSAASSNFSTAVNAAQADTKYSLGPEAASVLPYYLAIAQANGRAYGGFNTPPAVNPGAAVTQMHGQTIPGMGNMLPATVGAPPATDAAPTAPPMPPNALGVGAIGDQPAPGGGLPAPQTVAPPAVDPTSIGAPEPPQAMQQQAGGLAAMMGNVGPWAGGQQQQQPGAPTGLGALLMQRAGGYQPGSLNQSLLDAGLDPDIVAMFGGVG